MNHGIIAVLIIAAAVAGCVQQTKDPLMLIRIPGHPEVYAFSYDIRETANIASNGPPQIRNAVLAANSVTFAINATNETLVSGYYSKAAINVIQKLKTYQLYSGKIVDNYSVLVYDNQRGAWLNSTSETNPEFGDVVIWFDADAGRTSVDIENGVIYVRGNDYDNMVRAADKLSLIFMNVDSATLSGS